MTADAPLCSGCMVGAISTPATHRSTEQSKFGPDLKLWCLRHSGAGDELLPSTCVTCGAVAVTVPTCHPHPDLTDETIEQVHRRAFAIPRMAARPTTREGER